ncbi:MAG TPA: hypothetical protein VK964_01310 [Nocardioidaceae bacterium]|nr:hypothetical protein [Nocardioidaceae bacterium]
MRLWLAGESLRAIARLARVDRKTVRRYVVAAETAGLARGGEDQLTDELIAAVCEAVRPARPGGHGVAWDALAPHEELIRGWVDRGLRLTKIQVLLARRGVTVPYRTLHRFATDRCGFGQGRVTLPVADGEPGAECQVDFGRMGLLFDPRPGGAGGVGAHLHRLLQPALLSVAVVPTEVGGRDRGLRGRLGILRWRVPGADPRQPPGCRR